MFDFVLDREAGRLFPSLEAKRTECYSFLKRQTFLLLYYLSDSANSVILASRCSESERCLETEKGLFSQCLAKLATGGIAKPYLTSHMGGNVDVKLNDGRCAVDEGDVFYYFHASQKASECGTERRVSD